MEEIVKPELEIRIILAADSEIRSLPNSRKVEGLGIVFNKESVLMPIPEKKFGFYEKILPEATDGIIERSDVLCLLNHSKEKVLARSDHGEGSLKLEVDNRGLKYSFDSPKTALGDELIEYLKRGDIKGSSFGFRVPPGGDKWERRSDGTILRTINRFYELDDVSPCYRPAYEDTTVAWRSLDEFIKNEDTTALRGLDELIKAEILVEEIPIVENSNPVIEEPITETMEELKMEKPKRVMSQHEIELRQRNDLFKKGSFLTYKRFLK